MTSTQELSYLLNKYLDGIKELTDEIKKLKDENDELKDELKELKEQKQYEENIKPSKIGGVIWGDMTYLIDKTEKLKEENEELKDELKELKEFKEELKEKIVSMGNEMDELKEEIVSQGNEIVSLKPYEGDENFSCPVHYGSYGMEGSCICKNGRGGYFPHIVTDDSSCLCGNPAHPDDICGHGWADECGGTHNGCPECHKMMEDEQEFLDKENK